MMMLLVLLGSIGAAAAQLPTGTIAGIVTDPSSAALSAVQVDVVNRERGFSRSVLTSSEGAFSVPALPPGSYLVTAAPAGFKRIERAAIVEAGTTTRVDLSLELGEVTQTVTVDATPPLMQYDHHQVGGVVTRDQIERLPLNGRNFLELAKLEPGVTDPVRLTDNRTFVASLGAGVQTIPRIGYTRITVDGASITTPNTNGTILQVSQDVVQQFQMATVNFDTSTSMTTNGAINIVTRSGSNVYSASGFAFYRDHNLAAYPVLVRDPLNPDPFFRRNQSGTNGGGPIRKDRAFFFAGYERNDQRGVVAVRPGAPEFTRLGGIFSSPYLGNLFSPRADMRLGSNHTLMARYTHDGNRAFVGGGMGGGISLLPSGWSRRTVHADQSVVGLTSVLAAGIVNDVRLSYLFVDNQSRPATTEDCPGCFGVGAPRIILTDAGLTFGAAGTLSSTGHRLQFTDSLVWQKGSHRLQFGIDWEHAATTGFSISPEPAQITLWSPARVRQLDPSLVLPASFDTPDDVLRLPLRSFETGVGPAAIFYRDFGPDRIQDLFRLSFSDTWKMSARLTMNGGLAWTYEPNALNYDLTKPALLIPLLGADRLNPPEVQLGNVSPTLGFAWKATRDGRTVVRAGAGRYFDPVASSVANNLDSERVALLPLGTGRLIKSGSNILWDGRPLEFQQPTTFTGAQLMTLLPGIRAELLRSINPDNRDFSVRNIDLTKEGKNLYDPSYATPSALHVNLGVQRELAPGFVVGADFVWKRFAHTFINGIDYNRWNSVAGPVIPACTEEQKKDVRAVCSNGSIYFDTTIGRARYKGLLVRVEKRLARRAQFVGSYALGSLVGTNGTGTGTSEAPGGRVFGFNNDNWFENYGPLPTDRRHVLNLSGFVDLPWRFQAAFSVSAYSRPPFSPYVDGMDFNGDGTEDDLLPGTRVNQFGRGLDKSDLERLVKVYNEQFAGKRTARGRTAPAVTLPENYSFDDNFFTQDVRLSRTFPLAHARARLVVFAEIFNLFDVKNLVQFGSNLANTTTFGQPGARFTQVFGSGGPRAAQLGARVTF